MKNRLAIGVLLFSFFLVMHCVAQTTTFEAQVQPYLRVTNQAFFRTLSVVAEPYAENVDGFQFEWGYFYTLKIKKTRLKNPPMDGSDVRYELVRVVAKEHVPIEFTFKMQLVKFLQLDNVAQNEDELAIRALSDTTYRYFDAINFSVPQLLKPEFDAVFVQGISRSGTFYFENDTLIRLISIQ